MFKTIYASVHEIVDSVLRSGSINNKIFNLETMQEGTRLHNVYQNLFKDNYNCEEICDFKHDFLDFTFFIKGRADLVKFEHDSFILVELKTTVDDLSVFHIENEAWHLGQAIFYSYGLCCNKNYTHCKIKLVYITQNKDEKDEEKKKLEYDYEFDKEELRFHVDKILSEFIKFIKKKEELIDKRDLTSEKLIFPYETIRPKQQEMVDFCQEVIDENKVGYIEASTGIGKTLGCLYPYLKNLFNNKQIEKIFYLTSKNSLREVCLNNLILFKNQGVYLRVTALNSKDKLCINEKRKRCNPTDCKYAKNYYSKMRNIFCEILDNYDFLTFDTIIEIANKYEVCPFELQLDLSNFSDVIIGDYNYVFDDRVKLQRFFEDKSKYEYYLLIDEAHNLPSRVRDTYSEKISKFDVLSLIKLSKGKKLTKLKNSLKNLLHEFDLFVLSDKEINEPFIKRSEQKVEYFSDSFLKAIEKVKKVYQDLIKDSFDLKDEDLDFYTKLTHFIELPKRDDDRYAYFLNFNSLNECVSANIKCLDSKDMIVNEVNKFHSSLMFSATLQPFEYYLRLLGKTDDQKMLVLKSDFEKNNLLVLVNSFISTKYNDRDRTLSDIYYMILSVVLTKVGNYFVFLPSYEYLQKLSSFFINRNDIDIVIQDNNMSDEARKEFLDRFKSNPKRSCLGFIVLGGVFSEGIDLIDDRLIGAIIVSVGLPKISKENDALIDYYNNKENKFEGYKYAYVYPGIGKILQAAGRVIRSENDNGIILFIDNRYALEPYKSILKSNYKNIKSVITSNDVVKVVKKFWEEK